MNVPCNSMLALLVTAMALAGCGRAGSDDVMRSVRPTATAPNARLGNGNHNGGGPPASLPFDQAQFASSVDNPYFPLVPGTVLSYFDGIEAEQVVVERGTKKILGVATTIVHDQVFVDGLLTEDTFDWYAQDLEGNVWYFGEDTKELDHGVVVSTEGSWEAGVNGATAGIIMLADPQVGNRYYQEFAPKVAVDLAKVISLDGSACVPYGTPDFCSDQLLVTRETSQLDPAVVENKYYASGIGFIRAEIVKGGDEFTELVQIGKCR